MRLRRAAREVGNLALFPASLLNSPVDMRFMDLVPVRGEIVVVLPLRTCKARDLLLEVAARYRAHGRRVRIFSAKAA